MQELWGVLQMRKEQVVKTWQSIEDIAAYLGISKETVYRLVAKNKIPKHRLGKLWKFKTTEIDKWLVRK